MFFYLSIQLFCQYIPLFGTFALLSRSHCKLPITLDKSLTKSFFKISTDIKSPFCRPKEGRQKELFLIRLYNRRSYILPTSMGRPEE